MFQRGHNLFQPLPVFRLEMQELDSQTEMLASTDRTTPWTRILRCEISKTRVTLVSSVMEGSSSMKQPPRLMSVSLPRSGNSAVRE